MGWTSYHATHYKKGTIDRKAECDAYFLEDLNAGYYRVVKSVMVGSVYYGAIEALKRYGEPSADGKRTIEEVPENERRTFGVVLLTHTDIHDYYNFSYKNISEDMGPAEDHCPASVLNVLSPTDNEHAIEWRKRCRANIEASKDPHALRNLPIGSVIRFETGEGKTIKALRHRPAFQFKRPFWYCLDSGCYIPATRIPKNYEVVTA